MAGLKCKLPFLNRFLRLQKAIMARIAWPRTLEPDSLIYWRSFILSSILMAGLFLGILALVAGGVLIVKENHWDLAAIDLLGLVICLVLVFVQKIPFVLRSLAALLIVYLIGVSVTLTIGPLSGGPAWLFVFAVLSGVILGNGAALAAIVMNGLFLLLAGFLISTGRLGKDFPFFASPQAMIAAGVNFIVLNALAAVSVSVLVKGMFHLIRKQKNLTRELIRERAQLMETQEKLKLEARERKLAEKELAHARKMESIGTLAGGIAHDFNNILHMILGNTELVLEDMDPLDPAKKHLGRVREASLRAAGIIRQLLNFSSKNDQTLRPVNAVELIRETLTFLRSSIPANIEILTRLPDKEIIILADGVQINQVIMNLCINAAQAMEATGGKIQVSVDTEKIEKIPTPCLHGGVPGEYLRIRVSDTGPGILPEHLDKIFDPYFTTKELGKGSGMGLAVVHGIVTKHKGLVQVENRRSEGSLFRVFLPLTDQRPEPLPGPEPGVQRGRERILFIDDEDLILDMGKQSLEYLGYRAITRNNPLEALDLFRSRPWEFDLVITDMTMPGMTGDQLAEALTQIRKDIPIIICSGYSDRMDEARAKELGISRYLMKPVSISLLSRTIREVLGPKPDHPAF